MESNKAVAAGAIFAFLGVAAGAFGAHGLRGHLTPGMLAIYQTGVQYQVIHALGLLILGVQTRIHIRCIAWLFSIGIVIFSGSLYALAISGMTWFGAITPIGGILFLVGWAMLAWRAVKPTPSPS